VKHTVNIFYFKNSQVYDLCFAKVWFALVFKIPFPTVIYETLYVNMKYSVVEIVSGSSTLRHKICQNYNRIKASSVNFA